MNDDAENHANIDRLANGQRPVSMPVEDDHDDDEDRMDAYEVLIELDRLEELSESLDEVGAADRSGVEALPASPDTVLILQELDSLKLTSKAAIEARIAALEAGLDDDE